MGDEGDLTQTLRAWAINRAAIVVNRVAPEQGKRLTTKLGRWGIVRLRALRNLRGIMGGSIVVWPEPGHAELEPFEWSKPGRGQILIRTHVTLVSPGTERALFNNLPNAHLTYPYYPGYSGAGEVIAVGPGVTRFQVGERVAAPINHASLALVGEDRAFPIPEGVTMEEAAFIELGIIALQGVRKARIRLGESVAVLGQGLLGQLVIQLASLAGAYPVTAIARSEHRKALSQYCGAQAVINLARDREVVSDIEADVTFDVTGNPQAVFDAIHCTRPGGRVVLLGSNRGVTTDLDFGLLREHDLTLVGAHIMTLPRGNGLPDLWTHQREGEAFLTFVAEGRLDLDRLITDRIFPAEVERFYRRLSNWDRAIVAALLQWDELPDAQRCRARSFLSLPSDLVARGRYLKKIPPSVNGTNNRLASKSITDSSDSTRGRTRKGNGEGDLGLGVGLIGCGEIGLRNARAVFEAPNASLVMVMDLDQEMAADLGGRYDIPHTTVLDELLENPKVEAVLISTPPHTHAPLAIQSAQAGKHVMVEKPMAITLNEADEMITACQKAGVKLSVNFCLRYLPEIQKARQLIAEGALGKLLGTQFLGQHDMPPTYWTGGYSGRIKTNWRGAKDKGGGALTNYVVHYLDLLRFLTGLEIVSVYSEYATLDTAVEVEDSLSMVYRYDNGAIGNISTATCVRGTRYLFDLRLWGTEGHISLSKPFQFFSLRCIDGHKPGRWHGFGRLPAVNERTEYIRRFAEAVLQEMEPDIPGQDGRIIQAIVEAAYRSGEMGRPVEPRSLL